jgi:hypothetical protein
MLFYEIYGYREDGSIFGGVGYDTETMPEYEADAEAYDVLEHYARLWTQGTAVRLYRVPAINLSSVSSFDLWPDDMFLITTITMRSGDWTKHENHKSRHPLCDQCFYTR